MPFSLQISLGKIVGKGTKSLCKTTQPHCWRRHHHPTWQQLLSVTFQLQSGLFGFKKLCFSKDLPRQLSSPVFLLLLVCRWCLPDRPGVPKGQERY